MYYKFIFSIFTVLILSTSVFSDILPEGKKKISFSFEISNIDSYSDYVFLAYPVNTSAGAPNIECITLSPVLPVNLPCKFGPAPKIYAIKKELYNPETFTITKENSTKILDSVFANNKDLIPSIQVSCYGYADKNAAYNTVLDSYRIESISKDTLIIVLDKTVKKDSNGKIIDESKGDVLGVPGTREFTNYIYFALPFISLILVVTIIIIRKMKK